MCELPPKLSEKRYRHSRYLRRCVRRDLGENLAYVCLDVQLKNLGWIYDVLKLCVLFAVAVAEEGRLHVFPGMSD